MRTMLLVMTLVLTASMVGQEIGHAPTREACIADLNLWFAAIPSGSTEEARKEKRKALADLTYAQMTKRMEYVMDCGLAYPELNRTRDPERLPPVFSLVFAYHFEQAERMTDFLKRHQQFVEFNLEDEAGQR
jgi:hypothetical protein